MIMRGIDASLKRTKAKSPESLSLRGMTVTLWTTWPNMLQKNSAMPSAVGMDSRPKHTVSVFGRSASSSSLQTYFYFPLSCSVCLPPCCICIPRPSLCLLDASGATDMHWSCVLKPGSSLGVLWYSNHTVSIVMSPRILAQMVDRVSGNRVRRTDLILWTWYNVSSVFSTCPRVSSFLDFSTTPENSWDSRHCKQMTHSSARLFINQPSFFMAVCTIPFSPIAPVTIEMPWPSGTV